jgi:hypothetical protein
MKNPTVEGKPPHGENSGIDWDSEVDWDSDDDVDPIIAEIRRFRYERAAQFGFDMKRHSNALRVMGWAAGHKCESFDWRDPHGPREAELPADLTGLIPDREAFIRVVRMMRASTAKREPDLNAYNEDARRRALVLGFPAESFVIHEHEFPPDLDLSIYHIKE